MTRELWKEHVHLQEQSLSLLLVYGTLRTNVPLRWRSGGGRVTALLCLQDRLFTVFKSQLETARGGFSRLL